MDFEYDDTKSKANLAKHGIDFEAATALWSDPFLLVASGRIDNEPRFIAIGKIGGKHWSAIWTWRRANIRLISVRRARTEEIERYEGP